MCGNRLVQCVTLPCFLLLSPSLSSICSQSASICLFVSVTSTIGRQSALFSAINHSVAAITGTLFSGSADEPHSGRLYCRCRWLSRIHLPPPEQTYDLAAGSLVQGPAKERRALAVTTDTFIGGGHGSWSWLL